MSNFQGIRAAMRLMAAAGLSLLAAFGALAQTVRYIHTDGLGSPVLATDKDRNVLERSEYEPYGSLLSRAVIDGPGYTGHVVDAATELTYMQQRYYNSDIARFISVDPVVVGNDGENFNRYWYAAANPYKNIDPDGRFTIAVGRGGSAAAIVGISGGVQHTFSFPSLNPRTWRYGMIGQFGVQAGTDVGAGYSYQISISEVNSAEEMAGNAIEGSAGGSVNVRGGSIGYERTLCTRCKPTHTISVGGKLAFLPFEFHTTASKAKGSTLFGPPVGSPNVTVGQATLISSQSPPVPTVTVGEPQALPPADKKR